MSDRDDSSAPADDSIRRTLRRMGSVFVVVGLYNLAFGLLVLTILPAWFLLQGRAILAERPDLIRAMLTRPEVILGLLLVVAMAGFGPVIVSAGRRLREARSHRLATVASLLMVVLFSLPVWFFSGPFGSWSLWFLTRPAVKAVFDADPVRQG